MSSVDLWFDPESGDIIYCLALREMNTYYHSSVEGKKVLFVEHPTLKLELFLKQVDL